MRTEKTERLLKSYHDLIRHDINTILSYRPGATHQSLDQERRALTCLVGLSESAGGGGSERVLVGGVFARLAS